MSTLTHNTKHSSNLTQFVNFGGILMSYKTKYAYPQKVIKRFLKKTSLNIKYKDPTLTEQSSLRSPKFPSPKFKNKHIDYYRTLEFTKKKNQYKLISTEQHSTVQSQPIPVSKFKNRKIKSKAFSRYKNGSELYYTEEKTATSCSSQDIPSEFTNRLSTLMEYKKKILKPFWDKSSYSSKSRAKNKQENLKGQTQSFIILAMLRRAYLNQKMLTYKPFDYTNPFLDKIHFILPKDRKLKSSINFFNKKEYKRKTNKKKIKKQKCNFKNFFAKKPMIKPCISSILLNCRLNLRNHKEKFLRIFQGNLLNHRFKVKGKIGKGTYGEVVKCFDNETNQDVCIKIINIRQDYEQIKRELKALQIIKKKDTRNESNIYKLITYFYFKNYIFIVFKPLGLNLYQSIVKHHSKGIELERIRNYTVNILFALLYLQQLKIIHCDLKPENILIDPYKKNSVQLIDFGSCCSSNQIIYSYIQSRFYRAPEVILGMKYTKAIDIWSLGCILCELYRGKPIFDGEDERDVLYHIMEYLDIPPKPYILSGKKRERFFNSECQLYDEPNSRGIFREPKSKDLNFFLKEVDCYFEDFIENCLKWEPKERLTPEKALMHKWIIKDMTKVDLFAHTQKIKRILKEIKPEPFF